MEWTINEHLKMIQLNETHAEALFEAVHMNRAYLRQWLPWVDGTKTVADSEQFIAFTKKQFDVFGVLNFAIFYDNQFAGTVGTHMIQEQNKATSIGYWLSESFQGKGIMTTCTHALLTYLFEKRHLHRIEIRAAVENHASRHIPERLGFKEEGIARDSEWLYDHFVDHAVYSLLEGELK